MVGQEEWTCKPCERRPERDTFRHDAGRMCGIEHTGQLYVHVFSEPTVSHCSTAMKKRALTPPLPSPHRFVLLEANITVCGSSHAASCGSSSAISSASSCEPQTFTLQLRGFSLGFAVVGSGFPAHHAACECQDMDAHRCQAAK